MSNRIEKPESLCLCGSGQSYKACCQPYHMGLLLPENALKLMRSRYVAYALQISDYIIATTHPENPSYQDNLIAWKRSILEFSQSNRFERLEIVDFKEEGRYAEVTFIAHLFQNKRDNSFREKSDFEKVKGRWLYKLGHIQR